jgi:hypothetical protein
VLFKSISPDGGQGSNGSSIPTGEGGGGGVATEAEEDGVVLALDLVPRQQRAAGVVLVLALQDGEHPHRQRLVRGAICTRGQEPGRCERASEREQGAPPGRREVLNRQAGERQAASAPRL